MENLFEKNNWIAPLLAALGAAVGIVTGQGTTFFGMIAMAALGGGAGIIGGKVLQDFLTPKVPTGAELDKVHAKRGPTPPHARFFVQDGVDYKKHMAEIDTADMAAISQANDLTHDSKRNTLLNAIKAHDEKLASNKVGVRNFDVNIKNKLDETPEKTAPKEFYAALEPTLSSRIKDLKTELEATSAPFWITRTNSADVRRNITDGLQRIKNNDYAAAQENAKALTEYLNSSGYDTTLTEPAKKYVEFVSLLNLYDQAFAAREVCARNCTVANDNKRAQEAAELAKKKEAIPTPTVENVSTTDMPSPANTPSAPGLGVGIGQPKFA